MEAVIQNIAPVKHALETEKYCGGHEEDGNQHNDHLQVQPDKFEHRPQEEEAKGGGSGHKAPENLPLCGEGLANLEQTKSPVRLMREAETVYSCSVGRWNTKTKPTAMRTTIRLVSPPGKALRRSPP